MEYPIPDPAEVENINNTTWLVDPAVSELQDTIDELQQQDLLITVGNITVDSPITVNTPINWQHWGNITLDGNDFVRIGTDDSKPLGFTISVYGLIKCASDGGIVCKCVSCQQLSFNVFGWVSRGDYDVDYVIQFAPTGELTGEQVISNNTFWIADVTKALNNVWYIPSVVGDVRMQANKLFTSVATASDEAILFEDGTENFVLGDLHGGAAVDLDDTGSGGSNVFIFAYAPNGANLHSDSTIIPGDTTTGMQFPGALHVKDVLKKITTNGRWELREHTTVDDWVQLVDFIGGNAFEIYDEVNDARRFRVASDRVDFPGYARTTNVGNGFAVTNAEDLSGKTGNADGEIRMDDGTNTAHRMVPCVWDDVNGVWVDVTDGSTFT